MADKSGFEKSAKGSAEQAQRFGRGIMESAQQIWLAGLGAFAKAQQEGGRFFETLVQEGAQVQEKTRVYTQTQFEHVQRNAEPWLGEARRRTNDAIGKLEQAFDERIARAMQRLQAPTRDDIRDLSARIDELKREMRALHAPRKTAAKKSAPRDTSE